MVAQLKLRSSIQSLVPLLYMQLGSPQAAVDRATDVLIEYVTSFEETAAQLLESHSAFEANENLRLHHFIEGCRFNCSGNLVWRYVFIRTFSPVMWNE